MPIEKETLGAVAEQFNGWKQSRVSRRLITE